MKVVIHLVESEKRKSLEILKKYLGSLYGKNQIKFPREVLRRQEGVIRSLSDLGRGNPS